MPKKNKDVRHFLNCEQKMCLDIIYIYIYIYIYMYVYIKYKKKTGKWFEPENIQRITAKGKNIYLGKKRKGQPCHTNWNNQKKPNWSVKRKKNTVIANGLLTYNAKIT